MIKQIVSSERVNHLTQMIGVFSRKMVEETGDVKWAMPEHSQHFPDTAGWLRVDDFPQQSVKKWFAWNTILFCFVCASMNDETSSTFINNLSKDKDITYNDDWRVVAQNAHALIGKANRWIGVGYLEEGGRILSDVVRMITVCYQRGANDVNLTDTIPSYLAWIALVFGNVPSANTSCSLYEIYRNSDEDSDILQKTHRDYIDEWDTLLDNQVSNMIKTRMYVWRHWDKHNQEDKPNEQ